MMCAYLLKPEKREHGWLYRKKKEAAPSGAELAPAE
jgi:hypothetical protein